MAPLHWGERPQEEPTLPPPPSPASSPQAWERINSRRLSAPRGAQLLPPQDTAPPLCLGLVLLPPHPEPSAPEAPHLPQRLTPPGPAGALPKELTGPTLGGAAMGYRLPDICHEGLRGPPCFSQTPWGVGEGCPLSREGDRGSQGLSRVQDKPGPREAGCCGACLALATRRTLPVPGDEGSHEALPHCHQGSRQRCRGAGQTLKWTAPSVPGRCSPRPLLTPPAT